MKKQIKTISIRFTNLIYRKEEKPRYFLRKETHTRSMSLYCLQKKHDCWA